jgi:PAS domain S-box/uncharacterized domain HDIG
MEEIKYKSYYNSNTTYLTVILVGVLSTLLINSISKVIFLAPSIVATVLLVINNVKEISRIKSQYLEASKRVENIENFNNRILEKSPNGVIVIDANGVIEYVNCSTGQILGSTETVGLNILELNTIKNSNLYGAIKDAFNGKSVNLKHEEYTSYTSGETKILNLCIFPDKSSGSGTVEQVVILLVDVTEEFKLKEKVERTYLDTIEALASLVDARDPYTGQHSKNVSKYTTMICSKLDLPQHEKERIILSASFHDIGKVGVGDNVLNKAGKLTDEEYDIMKKHPSIGADIISKIQGFEDIDEMIRYHHERWDGRGYPSKLKENEIPYGSLIIAIADTYDAITSDRVYRKGLGKDKAIQILKEEKGKQFNAELVDVFLSIIET